MWARQVRQQGCRCAALRACVQRMLRDRPLLLPLLLLQAPSVAMAVPWWGVLRLSYFTAQTGSLHLRTDPSGCMLLAQWCCCIYFLQTLTCDMVRTDAAAVLRALHPGLQCMWWPPGQCTLLGTC